MAKKSKSVSAAAGKRQPAACIIPELLYLGPVSATSNSGFLEREGITHILSIGRSPNARDPSIQYERLGLLDSQDADIRPVVDKACAFIDSVLASNGKVLVHCSAAISRSPAIVAAYLIKRLGMTLAGSLEKLVEARGAVAPNQGFLSQLADIEKECASGYEAGERTAVDQLGQDASHA